MSAGLHPRLHRGQAVQPVSDAAFPVSFLVGFLTHWKDAEFRGPLAEALVASAGFVPDFLAVFVIDAERVGPYEQQARDVLRRRSMPAAVNADWQRTRDLGVTGAPTFVVGNQGVVGAQPYEVLQKLTRPRPRIAIDLKC